MDRLSWGVCLIAMVTNCAACATPTCEDVARNIEELVGRIGELDVDEYEVADLDVSMAATARHTWEMLTPDERREALFGSPALLSKKEAVLGADLRRLWSLDADVLGCGIARVRPSTWAESNGAGGFILAGAIKDVVGAVEERSIAEDLESLIVRRIQDVERAETVGSLFSALRELYLRFEPSALDELTIPPPVAGQCEETVRVVELMGRFSKEGEDVWRRFSGMIKERKPCRSEVVLAILRNLARLREVVGSSEVDDVLLEVLRDELAEGGSYVSAGILEKYTVAVGASMRGTLWSWCLQGLQVGDHRTQCAAVNGLEMLSGQKQDGFPYPEFSVLDCEDLAQNPLQRELGWIRDGLEEAINYWRERSAP